MPVDSQAPFATARIYGFGELLLASFLLSRMMLFFAGITLLLRRMGLPFALFMVSPDKHLLWKVLTLLRLPKILGLGIFSSSTSG